MPGPADSPEDRSPGDRLARTILRGADRTLLATGLLFLLCAPASLALSIVDPRTLDGVNVWHKPLKFQVSVAVFLVTLACMAPFAGERFRRSRWGRGVVRVAVATSVFEIAWITLQAARGQRSHYNADSDFGAGMYGAMGVAAVLLSLTPVAVAVGAALNRRAPAAFGVVRFGMLLGAVASLVGAAGIGLMLGGQPAHYPGADEAAGARIPVVGWSTTGGDLRIAHFVGLHALQGLFGLALLLSLVRAPARPAKVALALAGAAWVGATIVLARLALDGVSPIGG